MAVAETDLELMLAWREAGKTRPALFIIGTHCDLDPNFPVTEDKIGTYMDNFHKIPIVEESISRLGATGQVKMLLGSLKTEKDTEKLVYQLLKQLTQ
jgi:hypothetical protein